MSSLLESSDRQAIITRLRRLTPQHARRWGTMQSHQMVCHVSDALRVALGDLACRRRDSLLTRTLVKWLVIELRAPAPRGKVKTAPEMLTTAPATWDADRGACETLIGRMATELPHSVHPAFGPLSPREWGILAYQHLDHHLRQFGV